MSYTNNGTIVAGTSAQDILSAGHNFLAIIFSNEHASDNMRVAVDATATASVGTIVYPKTSATFGNLCGRKVSVYCATTSDPYSFQEALR